MTGQTEPAASQPSQHTVVAGGGGGGSSLSGGGGVWGVCHPPNSSKIPAGGMTGSSLNISLRAPGKALILSRDGKGLTLPQGLAPDLLTQDIHCSGSKRFWIFPPARPGGRQPGLKPAPP